MQYEAPPDARATTRAEADARLEAELTRYLEAMLAEPVPHRLVELAEELQKRLRGG